MISSNSLISFDLIEVYGHNPSSKLLYHYSDDSHVYPYHKRGSSVNYHYPGKSTKITSSTLFIYVVNENGYMF